MANEELSEGQVTPALASRGWSGLLHQVVDKAIACDVPGRAAQLAYYLLFALFPTLIFVALLISALPVPRLFEDLLDYFARVLPSPAFTVVSGALEQASGAQPRGLLSLSFLATIWASSSGMEAVIVSLNAAYHVRESRRWWRERLLAILLTLGLTIFIIVALVIVFFGGTIADYAARVYEFGEGARLFWHVAQWPIAAGFVLFGLDLIYYFAPNLKQEWKWVTPGASVAVVLWLAISLGLRFYLTRYSNLTITYGALGSFMVLMLWLYFASATILLGGVINGVLNSRQLGAAAETDDSA